MKKNHRILKLLFLICFVLVAAYTAKEVAVEKEQNKAIEAFQLDNIPTYNGEMYITIGDNIPNFTDEDKTTKSFEIYSDLDSLGRCGVAYANIGKDLMPTEERSSISQIKPTGWHSVQYDIVDGKSLYNRCHLIGYQLTAENANERNLITGTRAFNVEGMLPFENLVADYINETNNHVLYRVTPVFEDNNLVATGVLMEAYSVEDNGEGVCFHVFVFNVQDGIEIDYATGDSKLSTETKKNTVKEEFNTEEKTYIEDTEDVVKSSNTEKNKNSKEEVKENIEIRANSNSMIYHCPGQSAYENMADSKYLVIFHSEKEAQDAGYRKAKK